MSHAPPAVSAAAATAADRAAIQAGLIALCRAHADNFFLTEQTDGRCVILAELPISPVSAVILNEAALERSPYAFIPLETSVLQLTRTALASYRPGREIPIVVYANGPPRTALIALCRRRRQYRDPEQRAGSGT